MILRKYVINQKKFKIFLLLINLILIILTLIFLKFDKPIAEHVTINSKLTQFSSASASSSSIFSSSSNNNDIIQFQHNVLIKKNQQNYDNDIEQPSQYQLQQQQQQQQDGNKEKIKKIPIIPEKYNEFEVKQRIIQDKIKYLTEIKNTNSNNNNNNNNDNENEIIELKKNTQHIHIFYNLPVSWYKEDIITNTITASVAVGQQQQQPQQQQQNNLESSDINTNINNISSFSYSSSTNNNNNNNNIKNSNKRLNNLNKSILDTAYYPFRGPYKQDNRILREHLNSIRNAGIGVLVIELNSANTIRIKLLDKLFKLVPKYNISITFEINVNRNRTVEYLNEILLTLKQYFNKNAIYKVYSIKKNKYIPLIYVIDAYKLQIPDNKPTQCLKNLINLNIGNDLINDNNNYDHNDIILIAHIRFKEHTDIVKKLCFDGFYSKMPSNGAFYASTWKNWSFLSRYAKLNNMIFIPTVGPGYMQKKIPRHGGFEKDRSNGKYYGFAWSTAIAQNPQFISIASYNNWREGTQIEEATVKPNYMNYLPGKPTKYLHLTAHWANNYIKIKEKNQLTYNKCYNLFNNTIC